jgi:phage repressor protein C with HTH and peptisase S24 domain
MPIKVTLERAKNWYESTFPGNKLVQFTSTLEPCSINCHKHGLIEGIGYRNLRISKYGCPKCAHEARNENTAHTRKRKKDLLDLVNEVIGLDYKASKPNTYTENLRKIQNLKNLDGVTEHDPLECKSLTVESVKYQVGDKGTNPLDEFQPSKGHTKRKVGQGKSSNRKLQSGELSSSHVQPVFYDSPEDLPKGDFVLVPYHSDVQLAAGVGRYNDVLETISIPLSLPELQKLGVRPNNIICCRVLGDSMEPMLQDGALVGINTAETEIQNGKIYAFVDEDGLSRIKTLVKTKDSHIKIHSYNYAYPTEEVNPESIRVIGRLFWAASTF